MMHNEKIQENRQPEKLTAESLAKQGTMDLQAKMAQLQQYRDLDEGTRDITNNNSTALYTPPSLANSINPWSTGGSSEDHRAKMRLADSTGDSSADHRQKQRFASPSSGEASPRSVGSADTSSSVDARRKANLANDTSPSPSLKGSANKDYPHNSVNTQSNLQEENNNGIPTKPPTEEQNRRRSENVLPTARILNFEDESNVPASPVQKDNIPGQDMFAVANNHPSDSAHIESHHPMAEAPINSTFGEDQGEEQPLEDTARDKNANEDSSTSGIDSSTALANNNSSPNSTKLSSSTSNLFTIFAADPSASEGKGNSGRSDNENADPRLSSSKPQDEEKREINKNEPLSSTAGKSLGKAALMGVAVYLYSLGATFLLGGIPKIVDIFAKLGLPDMLTAGLLGGAGLLAAAIFAGITVGLCYIFPSFFKGKNEKAGLSILAVVLTGIVGEIIVGGLMGSARLLPALVDNVAAGLKALGFSPAGFPGTLVAPLTGVATLVCLVAGIVGTIVAIYKIHSSSNEPPPFFKPTIGPVPFPTDGVYASNNSAHTSKPTHSSGQESQVNGAPGGEGEEIKL